MKSVGDGINTRLKINLLFDAKNVVLANAATRSLSCAQPIIDYAEQIFLDVGFQS